MKSEEDLSGKPELTEENSGGIPAKFDASFSGKDFTGFFRKVGVKLFHLEGGILKNEPKLEK